jgi:iron complex transport system substrate-binding protein
VAERWAAASVQPRYAQNFSVEPMGRALRVVVHAARPDRDGREHAYLLLPCGEEAAAAVATQLDGGRSQPIVVPSRRIVTTSTSQVAQLAAIGASERIVGHEELDWVSDPILRRRIDRGEVVEVGSPGALNVETVVGLEPDLVLVYDYGDPGFSVGPSLRAAGVPFAFHADFVERSPLAQAEWLLFSAHFVDRVDRARDLFDRVAERYEELAALGRSRSERPRVLLGAPYRGVWWVPGGESFPARLIRDAGGEYLWADHPADTGVPLSLEAVFERADEADLWLHPSDFGSLEELRAADPRFARLPVFEGDRVWNNDARLNVHGGNDYWETGLVRPDLILADLIRILHPEALPEHQPVFHRRLR